MNGAAEEYQGEGELPDVRRREDPRRRRFGWDAFRWARL